MLLNWKMGEELNKALKDAERDTGIRSIVITGMGRAFFCRRGFKHKQGNI